LFSPQIDPFPLTVQVSPTDPLEKQDPSTPASELYRVDLERFGLLVTALTSWVKVVYKIGDSISRAVGKMT
jgi:hypothetical protein